MSKELLGTKEETVQSQSAFQEQMPIELKHELGFYGWDNDDVDLMEKEDSDDDYNVSPASQSRITSPPGATHTPPDIELGPVVSQAHQDLAGFCVFLSCQGCSRAIEKATKIRHGLPRDLSFIFLFVLLADVSRKIWAPVHSSTWPESFVIQVSTGCPPFNPPPPTHHTTNPPAYQLFFLQSSVFGLSVCPPPFLRHSSRHILTQTYSVKD